MTNRPRSTMDSIRASEAPDSGSIPDEATTSNNKDLKYQINCAIYLSKFRSLLSSK